MNHTTLEMLTVKDFMSFTTVLSLSAFVMAVLALSYNIAQNYKDKKIYSQILNPYREEFKMIITMVYHTHYPIVDHYKNLGQVFLEEGIAPLFVKRYLSLLNKLDIIKPEWNNLSIEKILDKKGMILSHNDYERIIEEINSGLYDHELLGQKHHIQEGNTPSQKLPFLS